MVWNTWQRWIGFVWPLVQQSAAAMVAWLIAGRVAGHDDPFFAPVAAVIGLNATLGRRGSNAVRLLAGVVIGVLVGEAAAWLAGSGAWTLAAATLLAMLLARTVDADRIVQAQAGISAILIIVVGRPEHGWDRLLDAVIGAAVALAFSQLLFTPEPLRFLRRTEAPVLSGWARGLRMIGDAVDDRDGQRAETDTLMLRNLRDDLAALSTARKAGGRIVRQAIIWRRRAALIVAERERADYLDLLAGSCLMLSRTAIALDGSLRARLAATVRYLAAAMEDLAEDPGDQAARQSAAERAADLAMWLVQFGGQGRAADAHASIRMVAADVMVFAGVDPERAFQNARPSTPSEE